MKQGLLVLAFPIVAGCIPYVDRSTVKGAQPCSYVPSGHLCYGGELGTNVRDTPMMGGALTGALAAGKAAQYLGNSQAADGYCWLNLKIPDGTVGWAAESVLSGCFAPSAVYASGFGEVGLNVNLGVGDRPTVADLVDLGVRWIRQDISFLSDAGPLQEVKNAGIKILIVVTNNFDVNGEKFGGVADAWEIGNEPDLGKFSPEEYAAFFRDAQPRIRSHSNAPILLGGLANGNPGYVDEMLATGHVPYDGVGIHIYGHDANGFPIPGYQFGSSVEGKILEYKRFGTVWVTEVGMNESIDAKVVQFLEGTYVDVGQARQQGANVPATFWMAWHDIPDDGPWGIANKPLTKAKFRQLCGK